MKSKSIFLVCVLCLICEESQCYQKLITFNNSEPLEYSTTSDDQKTNYDDIIYVQEISIDTAVFETADTVTIQLEGEEIVAIKKHTIHNNGIEYLYNAYETDDVYVFISKLGSNIQGIIFSVSGIYNIRTVHGIYLLEKSNIVDEPDEMAPIVPNGFFISDASYITQEMRSTSSIRVLVMYTPEALMLNSNMVNKVYLDINNGNTSLANSNINARMELAYIGETIDTEAGLTFQQLLEKFQTVGDGVFDEVHLLRNKFSADVCVLLVANNLYCGYGYVGSNDNHAFAVVKASTGCANKFSFTHEIGHNVGCGHDLAASSHYSPYAYGHGYVNYIAGNTSCSWRTMMAYSDTCGGDNNCIRIPYWSNPNVSYNGVPTGTITQCNNARVWNENATNVSAFRTEQNNIIITSADNSTYMDYTHWRASESINVNNGYEVDNGQFVKMSASNTITLKTGTRIKAGSHFFATTNMDNPSYPQFIAKPNNQKFKDDNSYHENHVHISPNPASSELKITINLMKESQYVSIYIRDISGQLLQKIIDNETKQQGITTYSTNVSSLSPGIFFIVVEIDNTPFISKLLKQ